MLIDIERSISHDQTFVLYKVYWIAYSYRQSQKPSPAHNLATHLVHPCGSYYFNPRSVGTQEQSCLRIRAGDNDEYSGHVYLLSVYSTIIIYIYVHMYAICTSVLYGIVGELQDYDKAKYMLSIEALLYIFRHEYSGNGDQRIPITGNPLD